MSPILRNILAVVAGIVIGSIVNMLLLQLGPMVAPLDPAIDPNDPMSLKENAHLLTTGNFVMTFIAHAGGTLIGALVASKIAASHQLIFALVIGALFLLGGIYMVVLLPTPLSFEVIDLVVAYLPMAWLGWKFSGKSG